MPSQSRRSNACSDGPFVRRCCAISRIIANTNFSGSPGGAVQTCIKRTLTLNTKHMKSTLTTLLALLIAGSLWAAEKPQPADMVNPLVGSLSSFALSTGNT